MGAYPKQNHNSDVKANYHLWFYCTYKI